MKNPQIKRTEDIVPVFNYNILESTKLSRHLTPLKISFDTVLEKRKSLRSFNHITIQDISDLLWHVAKVKTIFQQENGYILTHRGTASAGARHPIDIIISNSQLLSAEDFHYYNPFEHSLNKLAIPRNDKAAFFQHIEGIIDTTNATIIWFVAHKKRTSAKYSYADSLIYRDAGALIQAIQMVCAAMDINSCAIGSLGEPFISSFFNNQTGVSGAGGILIG